MVHQAIQKRNSHSVLKDAHLCIKLLGVEEKYPIVVHKLLQFTYTYQNNNEASSLHGKFSMLTRGHHICDPMMQGLKIALPV